MKNFNSFAVWLFCQRLLSPSLASFRDRHPLQRRVHAFLFYRNRQLRVSDLLARARFVSE